MGPGLPAELVRAGLCGGRCHGRCCCDVVMRVLVNSTTPVIFDFVPRPRRMYGRPHVDYRGPPPINATVGTRALPSATASGTEVLVLCVSPREKRGGINGQPGGRRRVAKLIRASVLLLAGLATAFPNRRLSTSSTRTAAPSKTRWPFPDLFLGTFGQQTSSIRWNDAPVSASMRRGGGVEGQAGTTSRAPRLPAHRARAVQAWLPSPAPHREADRSFSRTSGHRCTPRISPENQWSLLARVQNCCRDFAGDSMRRQSASWRKKVNF